MEARDLVALVLVAGCLLLVAVGRASWDQVLYVLMLVVGYYFGFKEGYARGVRAGA